MDAKKPDLIVGVDFGMTATGVSYANLSIGSETVKWIQKWPGRSQANENKVPTILVYPNQQPDPSSWGFLSETASEQNAADKEYKDWFKTYLDPLRLREKQAEDPVHTPCSIEEVERWYEDYHRLLYKHIEFKLSSELSGAPWQSAYVQFLFSVPTTWAPQVVERYRTIVKKAGFAQCTNHALSIGLTEAEAAAVHTSLEAPGIFRERDILLVCDAGGGTTDLSVLGVRDTGTSSLSLEQLDVVFGATIGSAAIDYDFEAYARSRLELAHLISPLPMSPDQIAWEMMKSRDFQNTKCEHGGLDDAPIFSIPIPKLDLGYANHTVGIEYGEMKFTKEELQRSFDKQVQKLVSLIDSQLQTMQRKRPGQQINHLILAGGLGHSPYVQDRLRARFLNGGGHVNAQGIQVRVAPDPQLAVCKGLVGDHVRSLKAGKPVLKWRCCRASYGTICKEIYDKDNPMHVGRQTEKDPMNGKVYVTQSIAWFIKKGKPITLDEPITRSFHRKISPGDPRRAFPTSIIESHAEEPFLPHYLGAGDAHVLCEIESDLSSADETKFKEKNRRFWSVGKHYFKVDYEVKVLIGPADVRFELWFNNEKLSKDQPIKVEWASPAPAIELPAVPQPVVPEIDGSQGEKSVVSVSSLPRSAELKGNNTGGRNGSESADGRTGTGGEEIGRAPKQMLPPDVNNGGWGRMF
ncbi:MAG: hypothetical protein L6R35_005580 [Caloplaca aegaea]|nr:MAG: hypothetical protein L6R35_005580 [Caloplaca aegaea]